MSRCSGKLYSKSPPSDKTVSTQNRSQGNHSPGREGAPPHPRSRHNEPAVSSNTGDEGNPPRLTRNDGWHTINNNQAQTRSNHSALDLRHHLNDKHIKSMRNNDDDDVGPKCFGPTIHGERFPSRFKGPREVLETRVQDYLAAMSIQSASSLCCARYFPLMMEGTART